MSMPNLSEENNINREGTINLILTSIGTEEFGLSHILNAEGEKFQNVPGTLKDTDPGEVTVRDVMTVNNSVHKTLRDVIKAETLLRFKPEDALKFDNSGNEG